MVGCGRSVGGVQWRRVATGGRGGDRLLPSARWRLGLYPDAIAVPSDAVRRMASPQHAPSQCWPGTPRVGTQSHQEDGMGRLEGEVALVTGAARGTGAEIAKLFVSEGAQVVAADVNDERGKGTVEALGAQTRYRHLDITLEADWAAAVEELAGREGKLDILVNNAGVLHLSSIDDTSLETFETVLRVNTI